MNPWERYAAPTPPQPPQPPAPPAPPEGNGGMPSGPWTKFAAPAAPPENVIARTADGGRVVQMADGSLAFASPAFSTTDQTAIAKLMEGATPVDAQNYANAPSSGPLAAAGGVMQGMLFGGGDEVAAALDSATSDRSYDASLERARALMDRNAEERPGAYNTGLVGGSILGALGLGEAVGATGLVGKSAQTAGPVAQAARSGLGLPTAVGTAAPGLAARVGGGAVVGAGMGAAQGFGSGEGGIGNRLEDALTGAVFGGSVGGAIPVVGKVASGLGNAVTGLGSAALSHVFPSIGNAPDMTAGGRAIIQALQRSGKSEADVTAALAQAATEGQPMYTVTDAIGRQARSKLNSIARQPGAAQETIADNLMRRQAGQGGRLQNFVDDALQMGGRTADDARAALKETRSSTTQPLYAAARADAKPVDLTGIVSQIDTVLQRDPILGETGLAKTEIGRRLAGLRSQMQSVETDAAGNPVNYVLNDFDGVLNVKEDLGRLIGGMKASGKPVPPDLANVYGGLDAALEAASPGYRAANDAYRAGSDAIRAVDTGRKAATSGRYENTIKAYKSMAPEAQAAARVGYGDKLIEALQGRPGSNKTLGLIDEARVQELNAMAADPELLQRQIAREGDMFKTYGYTQGGSQTMSNAADMTDAQRALGSFVGESTANSGYAIRRLAGRIGDWMLNGMTGENEATRSAIADALLSTDLGAALKPYLDAAAQQQLYRDVGQAAARSGLIGMFGGQQ